MRGANQGNSTRADTNAQILVKTPKMESETTNSTPNNVEEMNHTNGSVSERGKHHYNMEDLFNSDDDDAQAGKLPARMEQSFSQLTNKTIKIQNRSFATDADNET